jgi:CCR4-NOT transcription complex subunit 6
MQTFAATGTTVAPAAGPEAPSAPKEAPKQESLAAKIKVVTWNVLCDSYTSGKIGAAFRYCPHEFLKWSYRAKNIVETIKKSKADVICLQEVENFEYFWEPELGVLGYAGVHCSRTNRLRRGEPRETTNALAFL